MYVLVFFAFFPVKNPSSARLLLPRKIIFGLVNKKSDLVVHYDGVSALKEKMSTLDKGKRLRTSSVHRRRVSLSKSVLLKPREKEIAPFVVVFILLVLIFCLLYTSDAADE